MNKEKNILIVEGISDKSFFEELCFKHQLSEFIQVVSPKDIGNKNYNSKQGILNLLPSFLEQLKDAHFERLGIIVDADKIKDGGGFQKTFDNIFNILKASNLGFITYELCKSGFIFKNNDGLPDVGLWIMPNNKDDGILEDWIKASIPSDLSHNQSKIFLHAERTVSALSDKLFNSNKEIKAEVATWLAWQKNPGEGLYYAIKNNLLDESHFNYKNLLAWLSVVFK